MKNRGTSRLGRSRRMIIRIQFFYRGFSARCIFAWWTGTLYEMKREKREG